MEIKKLTLKAEIKSFDDNEMTITHYISTPTPDRYGDIVHPEGMLEEQFRKNPVVLLNHDSSKMIIGKNLWLEKTETGVLAKTQFADTETGREIYRLNKAGFMNAWSIGFMIPEGGLEMRDGKRHIIKWELLEYSSVAVPANPDCINLVMKSLKTIFPQKNITGAQMEHNEKIPALPPEKFKNDSNKNIDEIQDGRNFIKSIVYKNPDLLPASYKSNYLNEGTSADGGYTVPVEFYDRIMSNVIAQSVIRRNATIVRAEAKEVQIPKLSAASTFSFINEGTQKSVSNPVFAQIRLVRHDGGFIILLSKQLIEDSAFDIVSFLSDMASRVIANAYDSAGFKGSSGVITGILDSEFGATEIVSAGGTPNSIVYDDILKTISAVPSHTLPKSKFYMHRSMLGYIRRLKDETGGYIIAPDERKAMTMEGFPIELSDNMYSYSESALSRGYIVFGDLSTIFLHERKDLSISVSDSASVNIGGTQINLWQQGLIGLNFGVSFDIKAVFPENLAVIQTAAE